MECWSISMEASKAAMIKHLENCGLVVVGVDAVNRAPDNTKQANDFVNRYSERFIIEPFYDAGSIIDKMLEQEFADEMLEKCFPLSKKGKNVREAEINGWINGWIHGCFWKRVSSELPRWNPPPDSAVAGSFSGGSAPGGDPPGGAAPGGAPPGGAPLGGAAGGAPPGGGGGGDDNGHDRNGNQGRALREFFAILLEFLDSLTNLLNYLLAWRAYTSQHTEGLFSPEDALPLAFVALCIILYMVLMRHFGAFR